MTKINLIGYSWCQGALRNLRIYILMQKMRILAQSEKRMMIIGTIVNMAITFAVYAVFWTVVIFRVAGNLLIGYLGRWGVGETIMLVAFAEMAFALDNLTFYGIYSLDRYITEEGLEYELTKPISLQLSIMGKESEPLEGIVGISLSFLMLITASLAYNLNISIFNLLIGLIALMLGNLLMGFVSLTLAAGTILFGKLETLNSLLGSFYTNFIRTPLDVFPALFRIFCYIFPLIFVATIPTMFTLGMLHFIDAAIILALEGILIVFWNRMSQIAWEKALKRYAPTGG